MRDWKVLLFHPEGPSLGELARQAFSSTEKGYDLLAEKFDHSPYRTPQEILVVVAEQMEKMPMWDSALDICCGTGAMTQVLMDNTLSRVVGLDISRGMMDKARQNLKDHPGNHMLEFVNGEALNLPFKDEMDVVTNFGGLGHIMNKDAPLFLKEVYKALRPSGKFIFVTTEHPPVFSAAFWRAYSFNFLIHLRNKLITPPFIMYYLTFLLPKIKWQMENIGFDVEIWSGLFPDPFQSLKLVIATKKKKNDLFPGQII